MKLLLTTIGLSFVLTGLVACGSASSTATDEPADPSADQTTTGDDVVDDADGASCEGYAIGDACITEDNFAQCQEMAAACPGEVLAMESCPLQFACP